MSTYVYNDTLCQTFFLLVDDKLVYAKQKGKKEIYTYDFDLLPLKLKKPKMPLTSQIVDYQSRERSTVSVLASWVMVKYIDLRVFPL